MPANPDKQPATRVLAWLMSRPYLLFTALAAVLIVGVWTWSGGFAPRVTTVSPQRGDAAEVVYATGVIEPVTWAKVVSLQRRRIVDVCYCEGQPVKKGDVLVRLDDSGERAQLAELEARLARLREDVARYTRLVDRNVTSQTVLDEKRTQVQEYEARVSAQSDRIRELTLRAPMEGVVLRRDGEIGEIAGTAPTDILFWVGQPKPLRIVADVNEDDIFKVASGQRVLVRHDGAEGPLDAKVAMITPKGDPETKTFRVYLELPDDTPLKIGMSVEANIVVNTAENVLLVPAEAVVNGAVQVLKGDRVERVAVGTGVRGTRRVEIRSGIDANSRVVSPFQTSIEDGTRVLSQPAETKS